jgi:hypothetical protein
MSDACCACARVLQPRLAIPARMACNHRCNNRRTHHTHLLPRGVCCICHSAVMTHVWARCDAGVTRVRSARAWQAVRCKAMVVVADHYWSLLAASAHAASCPRSAVADDRARLQRITPHRYNLGVGLRSLQDRQDSAPAVPACSHVSPGADTSSTKNASPRQHQP